MSTQIQTNTWTEFKNLIGSKLLLMQYGESSATYDVFAIDGQAIYNYSIVKTSPASSDQTDFENNYQASSNRIMDATRSLLSQEIEQLSQIITNTSVSGIDIRPLLNQEVTQLSDLNTAVVVEVSQLTTLQLYGAQEITQLSQIITNTAVSGIDTRSYLAQEITQLSTLQLYGSQEVGQLSTIITLTEDASSAPLTTLLTQEVAQLTTLQLYGSQEVAQLSTLNLNVATAANQTAQITLLAQEVGQLSSIVTNTSVSGIDIRPLLSQEVTQLSNLNLAVALEVTQLSTVNVTLAQEAAQLTTLNTSNTSQVTLLAQEVVQLSQIISNTATSGIDIRPLLSQEVTQLSNLNLAVALEVSQLTTVNTTLAQEVAQLSTLNTSNSSQVTLLAQEVAQLSTVVSSAVIGLTTGQKISSLSFPIVLASDQSSVQTTFGRPGATKTNVFQTNGLVTTATTADQVILTYTVTSGKTFYLTYLYMEGHITAVPSGNQSPALVGSVSMETPSGTKCITHNVVQCNSDPVFPFTEPLPIASGTVIRVVCTPSATASRTWRANFGGYEV